MKKPNILHIPQWYPNPDDIQLGTFIQKQIIATATDCNNLVLSIVGSKSISDISLSINETNGIKEIQVRYCAKGNIYKRLKYYLKAIQQGLSTVADSDFYPDIIHCHVAGINLWVAEKYFKDTPVILSEHWSGYLDGRFDSISSFKKKKRIKRINNCKEVIAVSSHLSKAIKSKGINTNITVIDNVIDTKRVRKEGQNSEYTFLMVCDLVDSTKNVSGVIEAFNNYNKQDKEAKLKIIGEGKDKVSLQNQVSDLNLTESVEFIGRLPQTEVLEFYPKVDCLIVNSNFETYSMVTAEAILSGVSVIATRCKGPEQFINDSNGILVDLKSPDQLQQAMIKMKKRNLSSESIANSLNSNPSNETVRNELLKIYQVYL